MAASMPCKDCASGVLHEGTPAGREETIHGLPTYVTDPPSGTASKGIVAMVPDAFGWKLNNNRVMADNYARKIGCTVYLPDFMDGYVVDPSLLSTIHTVTDEKKSILEKIFPGFVVVRHMIPFVYYNRQSITKPRIFNWFTALRTSTDLPIGTAGYCWGGKFTVMLCDTDVAKMENGRSLVDAAYTAHPSQLDMPGDIESNGTLDIQLKPEGMETIKSIFAEKEGFDEGKYEMNVIEGAKHGFAIRGNPGDEDEKRRGQLAEDQAVNFFRKWLVESSKY